MTIDKYRAMDQKALEQEKLALLREQFNLRMQKATKQLTALGQLKVVRRNIARINTIITEKMGDAHGE